MGGRSMIILVEHIAQANKLDLKHPCYDQICAIIATLTLS